MVDTTTATVLIERIAAVAVAVSSMELFARRRQLSAYGLLSWEVARLQTPWMAGSPLLDRVFSYPNVLLLVGIRLVAAVALIVGPSDSALRPAAVTIVAGLIFLLALRTSYGNDGADQMGFLVFSALAFMRIRPSETVVAAGLWFIAMQCCLAYFTSGVAKLAGPRWRDGSGLRQTLSTTTYGSRSIAQLLSREPRLATILSWAVILTEIGFSLVLVAPSVALPWFLLGGAVFHISAAAVLGLNTFQWAFVGTYPAIVWCSMSIRQ